MTDSSLSFSNLSSLHVCNMFCAENPGAFPECSAVSRELPEGSGDLGKITAKTKCSYLIYY